jgi:hypothetical protein
VVELRGTYLVPAVSAVGTLEDGEVDLGLRRGALGAVVLPCCEEVSVLELSSASVQSARVVVVRGRREDNALSEVIRNLARCRRGGRDGQGQQRGEDEGREPHLAERESDTEEERNYLIDRTLDI